MVKTPARHQKVPVVILDSGGCDNLARELNELVYAGYVPKFAVADRFVVCVHSEVDTGMYANGIALGIKAIEETK